MFVRFVLLCLSTSAALGAGLLAQSRSVTSPPVIGTRSAPVLTVRDLRFKDLNKNGRLDPYEDWRQPVDARVRDLVGQMTLEEKAGLMVGPTLPMGPAGTVNEDARPMPNPFGGPSWTLPGTSDAILKLHMRQFINRVNTSPRTMATWLNAVQAIAESSRLGIPAFFVTNPRNHLGSGMAVVGIEEAGGTFSQWPGTLGLAATRDAALVETFSRVAAAEHVAVGIRGAYHPQIDLATEPRWARISGTFGEDADLTSAMAVAMVRGFQGPALGPKSVALIFKHFPGGGPAIQGQDSHFAYGKYDVYPGNNFDYHVRPFKAAIDAGAVAIMPYYSIPKDVTPDQVGMAFNKAIVTDLLRTTLGFRGVVNSDSGITTSMVWGVEDLSVEQRYRKAIEAGTDLFSNDATPEHVVNLVRKGELSEARVDESVSRLLRVRFGLGIFENPYTDPEEAERTIRKPEFQQQALEAQRKSIVLLHNDKGALPLKRGAKVFVEGVDAKVVEARGFVVAASAATADVAIVRLTASAAPPAGGASARPAGAAAAAPPTPGTAAGAAAAPRGAGLGGMSTGGAPIDLTLPAERLASVRRTMQAVPTVVAMYFDRPYVVPELARESAALVA
ncbi:MAG TPA: glycoside hydrolase family 3 N-terminal domain-containing protein, partial [Luteitalea sp.]|nr:glycoside hydrolase family 3 N-terminal domain-containing protein [Luteitalea sp.]